MPTCPKCDADVNMVRFASLLPLIPFIWYRDSSQMLWFVIVLIVVGPFLATMHWPIPKLFELKIPDPSDDLRADDELFS